jgi:hypothetical protein
MITLMALCIVFLDYLSYQIDTPKLYVNWIYGVEFLLHILRYHLSHSLR